MENCNCFRHKNRPGCYYMCSFLLNDNVSLKSSACWPTNPDTNSDSVGHRPLYGPSRVLTNQKLNLAAS